MTEIGDTNVSTQVVRLMFLLAPGDLARAIRGRVRGLGRRRRLTMTAVLALVVLPLAVSGSYVAALVLLLVEGALLTLLLSPRRLGRLQARRLLRDNPWLASPITIEAWAGGLRVQTATANSAMTWGHYPYRLDVEGFVLLLSGRGQTAQTQILPWEAVAEADRPALWALLAQHTEPLGPTRPGRRSG